ncbi:MAG: DNA oxidative demethylase AlkB [Cellvibrio sp.]|uniref:DNA oxidative demethylase AlkB n=1 Tax=Cellvibrio sp. TaxID=1965322 RepID=UPI0031A95A65
MNDLFENEKVGSRERLGNDAFVLKGFSLAIADDLLATVAVIETISPFRHMMTPGGFTMSVALTNCGQLGWTSDRRGYRYTSVDPITGNPWPTMPTQFLELAQAAANEVGFADFIPDACLINRYVPGTKLSLHQDKDEQDLGAPIVSVSLGIPAVFQFGGFERSDPKTKTPLFHGDVVVWGGADRLRYHGILPIKNNTHSTLGEQRINLTFRKASFSELKS